MRMFGAVMSCAASEARAQEYHTLKAAKAASSASTSGAHHSCDGVSPSTSRKASSPNGDRRGHANRLDARPRRLRLGADLQRVPGEKKLAALDGVALFARLEGELHVRQLADDLVLARVGHRHDEDELVLGLGAGVGGERLALELVARVGERGELVLREVDLELARILDVDDDVGVGRDRERLAHAIAQLRAAAGELRLERREIEVAGDLGLGCVIMTQRGGIGHRVETTQPAAPPFRQIDSICGVGGADEQAVGRAEHAKDRLTRAHALGLEVERVAPLGLAADGDIGVVLERVAAGGEGTGVTEVGGRAAGEGEAHVVAEVPTDDDGERDDGGSDERALPARRRRQIGEVVFGLRGSARLVGHSHFSLLQK